MPNWQPIWEHVRWNQGAAEGAIGALLRAAYGQAHLSLGERASR